MTNNEHWIYLEKLRKSGVTNMFGACPYLEKKFNIDHNTAQKILADWMNNYNPDDYKK